MNAAAAATGRHQWFPCCYRSQSVVSKMHVQPTSATIMTSVAAWAAGAMAIAAVVATAARVACEHQIAKNNLVYGFPEGSQ
jgi:hypothetical protein